MVAQNKTSYPEGYTVVQEAVFSGACWINYSLATQGKLQGVAFLVGLTNFTNWYALYSGLPCQHSRGQHGWGMA